LLGSLLEKNNWIDLYFDLYERAGFSALFLSV
jgi:hypothetical protein